MYGNSPSFQIRAPFAPKIKRKYIFVIQNNEIFLPSSATTTKIPTVSCMTRKLILLKIR